MSSDVSRRPSLGQALRSGLAYGPGLVVGSALDSFIIVNVSFAPDRDQESDLGFLLAGVLLTFLLTAIGGGIGGFIGGMGIRSPMGTRHKC